MRVNPRLLLTVFHLTPYYLTFTDNMKNIVILISGRGSNMQAIVEAGIPGARVAAVISNRSDAAGLVWARERGIPAVALDHKQFPDRQAFDVALAREIDRHQPDLVVLAGYMRILIRRLRRPPARGGC